ncbi:uncharacterized protein LOC129965545 isoform X3 [Argiope bruennichi]|uniref:uncharacterized protein LOC129965545 isoform X3 n=1 Tax=Argiope bruennichi TaxID=94029 RepID=UPI0024957D17|nr:uncharacterized protein LOC129965545 isoform X3 [Argiope bruennichi]
MGNTELLLVAIPNCARWSVTKTARGRRRAGTTYGRGKDTQEEIPSESQGSFGIPGSDGDVTTKRVLKTPSRPELRC